MVTKKDIYKARVLKDINTLIKVCTRCSLYKTKICDVSGKGALKTKIFFIGEAPGKEEDLKGEPFVGRAGKLLDSLFSDIKIKREEVFITNLVKHRPPKNRKPSSREIKACLPYLEKQIEIIDPQLIVFLGSFALNVFFPDKKISKNHGHFLKNDKRLYLPLYHPAATLYNQNLKGILKKDFQKIKKFKD